MYSLDDFDYELPPHLIAQYPLPNRAESRLLVVSNQPGESIKEQTQFAQIGDFLQPGDLLVVNNTKVIPARLYANKISGGRVEILLERATGEDTFIAMARANKPLKAGTKLYLDDTELEVIGRDGVFFVIKINNLASTVEAFFERHGQMPLPPYIDRSSDEDDTTRYQTVYGQKQGAVAAPTAGLHFTDELIGQLKSQGIGWGEVTLHVGAGTFRPVKVDNIEQHEMHKEWFSVDALLCEQIEKTKAAGGRVIAVGTTVVRALESAARDGQLKPCSEDTNIFIYPGFRFNVVDALITNFHLPKSTLLMLVSAFAGYERMMKAYQYAVANEFRFFSYGDAMLLFKES